MAEWFSNGQGELFKEFVDEPAGGIKKKAAVSIKTGDSSDRAQTTVSNKLQIPKEYIIFSFIIVILLVLGSFFLGIEKGKLVAKKEFSQNSDFQTILKAKKEPVPEKQEKQKTGSGQNIVVAKKIEPEKIIETKKQDICKDQQKVNSDMPQAAADNKRAKSDPYAVQVITYAKADLAQSELEALKKKGFSSFKHQSGKYHVVFVGPFNNKQCASKVQQKLVKVYKDCFLKKIK